MLRLLIATLSAVVIGSMAFAQATYRISPGDQLTVEVLEDASLNRQVLVLPDGFISFPLAGVVRVGGRTLPEVQATLRDRLASSFAAPPTVFVSVGGLAPPQAPGAAAATADGIDVFLIGAVNSPGRYRVDADTTVLQFLAQSGGFGRFAATGRIQIRRADPDTGVEQVYGFDYQSLDRGKSVAGANAGLRDGDIIVVPERRLFE